MVFKSFRVSPPATALSWGFREAVFYAAQDHPAYIPHGKESASRPTTAARPGPRRHLPACFRQPSRARPVPGPSPEPDSCRTLRQTGSVIPEGAGRGQAGFGLRFCGGVPIAGRDGLAHGRLPDRCRCSCERADGSWTGRSRPVSGAVGVLDAAVREPIIAHWERSRGCGEGMRLWVPHHISRPVPPVRRLEHDPRADPRLGDLRPQRRRAVGDPGRVQPPPSSVIRTSTLRRRCRSIPTTCLPSYASVIVGLPCLVETDALHLPASARSGGPLLHPHQGAAQPITSDAEGALDRSRLS